LFTLICQYFNFKLHAEALLMLDALHVQRRVAYGILTAKYVYVCNRPKLIRSRSSVLVYHLG